MRIFLLTIAGAVIFGTGFFFAQRSVDAPAPPAEVLREPQEHMPTSTEDLPKEKEAPPKVELLSAALQQADVFMVRVEKSERVPRGTVGTRTIDFVGDANGNWVGIVAFDVKERPGAYNVRIVFPDGSLYEKTVTLTARTFPVTQLVVTEELAEKGYTPENITAGIAEDDSVLVREAMAMRTNVAYFNDAFIPPLPETMVVGAFGNIRKKGTSSFQHLGVDLDAPLGAPIMAMNSGKVRFVRALTNYGNTVIIDHGLGIYSLYLHLNKFAVREGDRVVRGQSIGYVGDTGYAIDPHLHLSMKVQGASVDPLRFIEVSERAFLSP